MRHRRRAEARGGRRLIYGITSGTSAKTLLRGQLAWLAGRGWEVSLAADPDAQAHAAAQAQGVTLHPLPMVRPVSPRADLASFGRWLVLLWRERPDVVNVSTPKAGLLGGVAAWVLRVPRRVYVIRGLRLEGVRGPGRAVLWAAEKVACLAATDVVAVSASLARACVRHRLVRPGRIWLVGEGSSNGVDAGAVAARVAAVDPSSLREDLGLAPDDFVVGFVGRLTADKGLATLVGALRDPRLPDHVRLLVVGSAEDEASVTALASLGPRVRVVGWTDDVWAHYAAMDVLCLPTRREGFPNVVLEAAAAGVPSLVTRATGAVDAVVDHETGRLFGVDDAAALAGLLIEVVQNPADLARWGELARRRAVTAFAPERIWKGIEDILAGRGEGNADLRRG